jgi:Ni2+-binding GTPase involved in maturation of urease and hydrogenase
MPNKTTLLSSPARLSQASEASCDPSLPIPRLILVGGFLGAGKSTLLAQAALRLSKLGHRVGLVANDQAAELVDSEVLKITGASVEEVAGGCFCCRFPDMITALERLAQRDHADVLLGEPVGSCTDLAATVMRPLKQFHAAQFNLAPLSVLVDGNQVRVLARLRTATEQRAVPGRFPDNVLYIYEKQLEEADIIVLNKADRLAAGEEAELTASLAARFPGKPLMTMSALSGEGVDAWLRGVAEHRPAGRNVVEVDYDTYAAGEAALGWLNASVALHALGPLDWRGFAEDLLEEIRRELAARGAEIAHIKLIIGRGHESLTGNVTSNHGPAFVQGRLDPAASQFAMRINARVHLGPDKLQAIVEDALRAAAGGHRARHGRLEATITALSSLRPGRPVPTHRFAPCRTHHGGA